MTGTRQRFVLHGDRHDTALTERVGLFSVYCGCGWRALDLSYAQVLSAESDHCRNPAEPTPFTTMERILPRDPDEFDKENEQ